MRKAVLIWVRVEYLSVTSCQIHIKNKLGSSCNLKGSEEITKSAPRREGIDVWFKATPKRSSSFNRKTSNLYHANGNGKGSMTPMPRRGSIGGATPELLTPRSHSGRQNGYFRDARRSSTTPLKFMGVPKEDTMSYASVSIYGSELGSPCG
ncbi:65-kDa microtubule-associated protein 6 [Acorus calamus]|uniref:65-kDa microtubule-associated protein 6 n=1 Tax=Acorus calamus TaxID=4465 RepID=A0AAV9ERF7_ACOCL|nr:65-kDa microtubule-associated protein 6 [Acorus calamus]